MQYNYTSFSTTDDTSNTTKPENMYRYLAARTIHPLCIPQRASSLQIFENIWHVPRTTTTNAIKVTFMHWVQKKKWEEKKRANEPNWSTSFQFFFHALLNNSLVRKLCLWLIQNKKCVKSHMYVVSTVTACYKCRLFYLKYFPIHSSHIYVYLIYFYQGKHYYLVIRMSSSNRTDKAIRNDVPHHWYSKTLAYAYIPAEA